MDNNDFIKGALVGSLVGGAAGLLLAPKAGKELRDDINDACHCFGEKAEHVKDHVKAIAHEFNGVEEERDPQHFIIGSVLGAVLGATAAVMLAPKAGKELRKDIKKVYHDVEEQAEDWKENVTEFANKFVKAKGGKIAHDARGKLDDFLELAELGLRTWKNFQQRR